MMDQGDFDFNVFLDRKGEKKENTELLTKEELEEAVEILKGEGVEKYKLLTINESALQKFNVYKKMLLYFNIPLAVALPMFCEFFLDFTHPKANALYALLYTADTLFFVNAYIIYKMLRSAVISINYLVEEQKFEIKHLPWFGNSKDSSKSTTVVDPLHMAKAPKAMINPFVGYRNTSNNRKYITEGM